jgi:CheY-like chemotaxis protein
VQEALRLWAARPQPFELLITDVLMPDGTGPELADRLRTQRPALLVLFTSGYPASALGSEQFSAGSWLFLPKPFTPTELLQKVSSVLAAPEAAHARGALERVLDS